MARQPLLATLAALLALSPGALPAQDGSTLRVIATNVKSDQGSITVWVYDDPDTWLSDRYRTQKSVKVQGNRQGDTVTLELLLPAGEYALSIFQDVNDDGKLARNFIGLPKEPAGFSNNYRPMGPPKFAKAAFKLEGEAVEQRIQLE